MRLSELKDWYTASQAAAYLGVSRQHVSRLAQDGEIKAVSVGSSHADMGRAYWALDPESIEAFKRERDEREQAKASKGNDV